MYARIDNGLKDKAEGIRSKLGISPTSSVQMLYSPIVFHNCMPFKPEMPVETLVSLRSILRQQFDYELLKGFGFLKSERIYTADEIDAEFNEKLNLCKINT